MLGTTVSRDRSVDLAAQPGRTRVRSVWLREARYG